MNDRISHLGLVIQVNNFTAFHEMFDKECLHPLQVKPYRHSRPASLLITSAVG